MTAPHVRPKPIALDRLLSEAIGDCELFGRVHDVLPLNAVEYQLLQAGHEPDITRLFEIANRIVPTLTEEEQGKLTPPVVLAVIAIADGRVADVIAQFPPPPDNPNDPNGTGPAGSDSPPA